MKKLFLTTIAIAIIGGVFLNSCQKDNEVVTNPKILKSGNNDLKNYEVYSPEQSSVQGKLLQITSCINNPNGSHMPNMELKEAIWFLEAFFNVGVCEKQEYSVEVANITKTYSIVIPVVTENNGNIILNGRELQLKYGNLLRSIMDEICSDYSINFGDLYVKDINIPNGTVILDLEIKYGQKAGTPADWSQFSRLKIVGRDFPNVTYPHGDAYNEYTVWNNTVKDEGMTITLNQEKARYCPSGIIDAWFITQNSSIYGFSKDLRPGVTSVIMTHGIYNMHGQNYKNDIWNNIVPRIYSSYYYSDYEPLWAFCNLKHTIIPNSNVKHEWGIEKVCQFAILAVMQRRDEIKCEPVTM